MYLQALAGFMALGYTLNLNANDTSGLTGGIIDSTDYIDKNAYANDEFTQFMNEALVSGPNGIVAGNRMTAEF